MPADLSFEPEPEISDVQRAAIARADQVAALHRERHGYLVHGKTDRAAAVAEQLAALGAPIETPTDPPASGETPTDPPAPGETLTDPTGPGPTRTRSSRSRR